MGDNQIQGGNLPLSESDRGEFLPEFDRLPDLRNAKTNYDDHCTVVVASVFVFFRSLLDWHEMPSSA